MLKEISGVLKIKRKNNNKNRTEPKTVTLKRWYEPNCGFCEPCHPYLWCITPKTVNDVIKTSGSVGFPGNGV